MIERIKWNSKASSSLPSPFLRGQGERSLNITFHSISLANATGKTSDSLQALQELGYVDGIKAIQTEPGNFPHINIGDFDIKNETIPVQLVENDKPQVYTGISFAQQLFQIAATIAKETNQNAQMILNDLLTAEAHIAIGGDILVTASKILLENRHMEFIGKANPYPPEEAAQIVGLFLRSRNNYTYSAGKHSQLKFDRGLFYWVLARYRLPSMWRYFSGCLLAGKQVGEDLEGLGGSILIRAVRALEARDAIGTLFYVPQNNNIKDQIMYHFDYLTLVLSGALDAQAKIARIAYNVELEEREASFRYKRFKEALIKNRASELIQIFNDPFFNSYLFLLYELRNTIHGSAMKAMLFRKNGAPEITYVEVPNDIGHLIWAHAEIISNAAEWGLNRELPMTLFEPYSYATCLVKYGLTMIDKIAAATDVTRLFPPGSHIPPLTDRANDNRIWGWSERISILA